MGYDYAWKVGGTRTTIVAPPSSRKHYSFNLGKECKINGHWAFGADGYLRKMDTRKNGYKGKWALGANQHHGKIRANGYFGDKWA